MNEIENFISSIKTSIDTQCFVKITLSKLTREAGELQNVYVRMAVIKDAPHLSFTYHYRTNDQTKNFDLDEAWLELNSLIAKSFLNNTLFTTREDITLHLSKKGKAIISKTKPSFADMPDISHDRQKVKRAHAHDPYLKVLEIVDPQGMLIPKMADKFRQINKYLEIIESLIKSTSLPEQIEIVDMGSGKGYLTFALYDYLKNKLDLNVIVTGIEIRKELVDDCNAKAKLCGFHNLKFENGSIENFNKNHVDIVIALHACDTATDDALAKAIGADASLIVCAPCCHKQVRQQVKGKEQDSPLMKYGIFKERQFEMVTDTIRALILEKKNYETKIFEFVSNEHTRKNIMLVGSKTQRASNDADIDNKINNIKLAYQIDYHYLEKIT